MSDLYYNTNHEKGPELAESRKKVASQEERILSFFKLGMCVKYGGAFPPSQVYMYVRIERPQTPITSIRRAMTNLTIKDKLVKTDKMAMGPYKKREHLWELPGE